MQFSTKKGLRLDAAEVRTLSRAMGILEQIHQHSDVAGTRHSARNAYTEIACVLVAHTPQKHSANAPAVNEVIDGLLRAVVTPADAATDEDGLSNVSDMGDA